MDLTSKLLIYLAALNGFERIFNVQLLFRLFAKQFSVYTNKTLKNLLDK